MMPLPIRLDAFFTIRASRTLESLASLRISPQPHSTWEYHPPVAVLGDAANTRWPNTPFQERLHHSSNPSVRVCVDDVVLFLLWKIHDPRCLRGSISGGWQIISMQSRERKTGLHLHPLNILKDWKVNRRWIIFLSQVSDSYQPEVLRVLRVHRLESNIIKNKHNSVQIISLGIFQKCVIYYSYNAWNNIATFTVTPCYEILTLKPRFPSATGYSSLSKGRFHGAYISIGLSSP